MQRPEIAADATSVKDLGEPDRPKNHGTFRRQVRVSSSHSIGMSPNVRKARYPTSDLDLRYYPPKTLDISAISVPRSHSGRTRKDAINDWGHRSSH
ncbi:MAG: hypothetical protein ACLR8Y_00365 [Alistipes indistinctus]